MARSRKRDPSSPNTEQQEKLANEVVEQYEASWLHKDELGLHDEWQDADDYYRGEQVEADDDEDPAMNTNVVRPAIEGIVSDLVEEAIGIEVRGDEFGDALRDQHALAWCEWIRDQSDFTVRLDNGERWRTKYGTVGLHIYFDPQANGGLGAIVIAAVHPQNVFPDPKVLSARAINKGDYVIIAEWETLQGFRRLYGERGRHVKPEMSPRYDPNVVDRESQDDISDISQQRALHIQRYSFNDDGTLRVVRVGGTQTPVLLYDSNEDDRLRVEGKDARPFYKRLKWNYPVRLVPFYPREGMPWGDGFIKDILKVQDLINELDDSTILYARLAPIGQYLVGVQANINPYKWNPRKPALLIPTLDVNGVKELRPGQFPEVIPQRREMAKLEVERVTGRGDVTEGRLPGGAVPTATAVIALQNAAGRKAGHQKRILQHYLGEMFEAGLELVKEFLTEFRAVPNPNKRPGQPDFLWLRGEDLTKVPKMVPDDFDPETGQPTKLVPLKDTDGNPMTKDGRWRVRVTIGGGIAKSPLATFQLARELVSESAGRLLEALTPEERLRVVRKLWQEAGMPVTEEPPAELIQALQQPAPQPAPPAGGPAPAGGAPPAAPAPGAAAPPPAGPELPPELAAVLSLVGGEPVG